MTVTKGFTFCLAGYLLAVAGRVSEESKQVHASTKRALGKGELPQRGRNAAAGSAVLGPRQAPLASILVHLHFAEGLRCCLGEVFRYC